MNRLLPLGLIALSLTIFLPPENLSADPIPQPLTATINASNTHAPISKYIYGQFLEHLGNIINANLWAEMLDDRKFYYPITSHPATSPSNTGPRRRLALRHWYPIGPDANVVMDATNPYVGDQSPRITLDSSDPHGIRQSGLSLVKGMSYTGRIILAADQNAQVTVTLIWGPNPEDRQSLHVGPLSPDYAKFPLAFSSPVDTDDATFEITATGSGTFSIGAVSLMPSNNIDGFRAEVIDQLKQLHSGVYRFPGGNYVSAADWRDAIGDIDLRPPTWDPAWNALQPNDVGTDELITMCRLLDVEPYICVNAGFGDARSAAEYVEYCNGNQSTPMGRLRAANGHPRPFNVKFWGVGNEAWGDWQFGAMSLSQFELKNNLFAKAMRRADPSIKLIASGAMPDSMVGSKQSLRLSGKLIPDPLGPGDWSGGLLANCRPYMDLISQHFYSYNNERFDIASAKNVPVDPHEPLIDWMRRPANHIRDAVEAYETYERLIPGLKENPVPIALDEWAYARVPPNSYKVVPAYAWTFHEMFRHSDLFQLGAFTFATSMISTTPTQAELSPAGLLFQMYRNHFGSIPVDVEGNSPPPKPIYPPGGDDPAINAGSDTSPLDVAAALTDDKKSLTVAIINPTESAQQITLSFTGATPAAGATLYRMSPSDLNATITIGQPPSVKVDQSSLDTVPQTVSIPPFSVSIYDIPVRGPS